jgi:hypothetical protein
VQVHHQTMQAVRMVMSGLHHCGDGFWIKKVAAPRRKGFEQSIEPRLQTVWITGEDGCPHQARVSGDVR